MCRYSARDEAETKNRARTKNRLADAILYIIFIHWMNKRWKTFTRCKHEFHIKWRVQMDSKVFYSVAFIFKWSCGNWKLTKQLYTKYSFISIDLHFFLCKCFLKEIILLNTKFQTDNFWCGCGSVARTIRDFSAYGYRLIRFMFCALLINVSPTNLTAVASVHRAVSFLNQADDCWQTTFRMERRITLLSHLLF